MEFVFDGELWCYPGETPWYFVTLPADASEIIREETAEFRRGFGSVRVIVTIGESVWNTSVFPEAKSKRYVLPIKKPVRRAEQIDEGDVVTVSLRVLAGAR